MMNRVTAKIIFQSNGQNPVELPLDEDDLLALEAALCWYSQTDKGDENPKVRAVWRKVRRNLTNDD